MSLNGFIQRWFRAEIALAITGVLFIGLLLWTPAGFYAWIKAVHVIAIIS